VKPGSPTRPLSRVRQERQPLGGGRERALVVRGEPVRQLDQQHAGVPAVGVGEDAGETGRTYLCRKARPPTAAAGGPRAGGGAQAALGQVGEERAEVLRPCGRTPGEGADRGDAERRRPVQPVGPGQPTGKHRDGRRVQFVEDVDDQIGHRGTGGRSISDDDRRRCRRRVEGDPEQFRVDVRQVTDLVSRRNGPPTQRKVRIGRHGR
jgi:hypothetical protein